MRYAGESLRESVVVFNGDVLTQVDLASVIALHRERKAKVTIAGCRSTTRAPTYSVETDARSNIRRFLGAERTVDPLAVQAPMPTTALW